MSVSITVPETLRRREGDALSADAENEMLRVAEALTLQRGRLKGRQEPGGFVPTIDVTIQSTPDYAFKATLGEDEDGTPALTFITPGHIGGVVPVIAAEDGAEREIASEDEDGGLPFLRIEDDAFAQRGAVERALVMFRYELRKDEGSVEKVVVVAVPEVPKSKAWTWHKLAGFVTRRDGSAKWQPMIFFSQQFDISNAGKDGRFKAWPRIA